MTTDQIQTILILVTLLLAGIAIYKRYTDAQPITLTAGIEEIKNAVPVAKELMEIAQIAVNSAEQLKREGAIDSNDAAFHHAYSLSKKWIPDEWEIDNEDLISAINAAVLVASVLAKQAGISSEKHG